MADYGLLSGLANGIKEGFGEYRSERDYQEKKKKEADAAAYKRALDARAQARADENQSADFVTKGLVKDESGAIHKSDDQKYSDAMGQAEKQAALLKSGYKAEIDPATGRPVLNKIPGFKDLDDQVKRGQIEKNRAEISKLIAEANALKNKGTSNKAQFEALPIENQEQIKKLSEASGTKKNIRNAIAASVDRLEDPNLSEEQKLVHARSMIKLLNSQAGQDAVGAEEAKRLAGYLEFHVWPNLTDPGPVFGRAKISDFAEQSKQTLKSLDDAIQMNESNVGSLYGRDRLPSTQSGLLPKGQSEEQEYLRLKAKFGR